MSQAFPNAVGGLDVKKYIDEIQDELKKILESVGPGKTPKEIEETQVRLQALLRKQSQQIAKDLALRGNHVFLFMTASAIITTAWAAFYIRRQMDDMERPFEERITLTDLLNSLQIAMGNVIQAGTSYAEIYGKK